MPFIHAGPLQAILSNRFPTGLPDQFLAILFHQLLRGLVCLHEMGFVHKAIKASNVFFDSQGSVKLSDLSVSSTKDEKDDNDDGDDECSSSSSSSVPYWVPVDEEYSFKSDVWSIGILAMEIAYGGPPISDTRIIRSQISSISRRFPYDLNLGKTSGESSSSITNRKFGDSFKDFVSSCLVKDRFRRPSASSLLAHPFVKKGESSNFLFKSIAKGMVGIGDKFQRDKERLVGLMKKKKKNSSNYYTSKKNVKVDKILKISGWDYNNFLFELEPDEESLGKRVRFRGETIIQFREDQETKIDMPSAASLVERIDDKFEVMDSENLAKVLSSLLESVDQQRNVIMMLITQFGYLNQRELEMTKEITRLEAELTSEKEKSFQLELDYEVLKLKVPDSEDEEEDQEDNS